MQETEFTQIILKRDRSGKKLFESVYCRGFFDVFYQLWFENTGQIITFKTKKSFRIFFKSAYDRDRLEYPVFGNSAPQSYKNLVLRAGYDDDIQMTFGTLIRDPLVSSIWKDLGMLVSKGNFSNLYINDQYWGIYIYS